MTKKPRNFQSYKEEILKEDPVEKPSEEAECWVDDDNEKDAKPEDSQNHHAENNQQEKPVSRQELPPNQSKKGDQKKKHGRGGIQGKSVYQMTKEEREKKKKLQVGREIQTRKKGGHHDRKAKATKKYNI